jgi:hypothetical protein|tara:strand:+ start:59 stop:220 length:162 start_codon:yes stop_codon:yes gene_type:complete
MGDDDNDLEERFALKVKPDTRIRQVRHFKPEVVRKFKELKKNQKQNKEKKNER